MYQLERFLFKVNGESNGEFFELTRNKCVAECDFKPNFFLRINSLFEIGQIRPVGR